MKQLGILSLICCISFGGFAQDFDGLIKVNGTSLHVHIEGKGAPLLILHGGPGLNKSYLIQPLRQLTKKNRVVWFDQRASGKSAVPSGDSLSLRFFTEDIEGIRQYLGVEQINILAHSWGAIPALSYGIKYPSRVGKMVLVNPVPMSREFDGAILKNQQALASRADSTDRSIIIGSRGYRNGETDAFRKLIWLSYRHAFYDSRLSTSIEIEVQPGFRAASKALQLGLTKDMESLSLYESLNPITFPVLILHGAADPIPLASSTLLQSKISGSTLIQYSKGGHFLFIEQPRKFKSNVQGFLAGK